MKTIQSQFSIAAGLVLMLIFTSFSAAQEEADQEMILTASTEMSVQETVDKISANAKEIGWVVSGVSKMEENLAKQGQELEMQVHLVNLCQPEYAAKMLKDPESRYVSVMMPCTVSVYEGSDGKTHVAYVNSKLVGQMMGGTVAEVMGGPVAEDQDKILEFLSE